LFSSRLNKCVILCATWKAVCSCSNTGDWFIAVLASKARVLIQFLCLWLLFYKGVNKSLAQPTSGCILFDASLYLRYLLSTINSSLEKIKSVLLRTLAQVFLYYQVFLFGSNKAETCRHNKILIFINCCVLTVNLKHFVSLLELKHQGMSSIKVV
jgi:hypothetical protein